MIASTILSFNLSRGRTAKSCSSKHRFERYLMIFDRSTNFFKLFFSKKSYFSSNFSGIFSVTFKSYLLKLLKVTLKVIQKLLSYLKKLPVILLVTRQKLPSNLQLLTSESPDIPVISTALIYLH